MPLVGVKPLRSRTVSPRPLYVGRAMWQVLASVEWVEMICVISGQGDRENSVSSFRALVPMKQMAEEKCDLGNDQVTYLRLRAKESSPSKWPDTCFRQLHTKRNEFWNLGLCSRVQLKASSSRCTSTYKQKCLF